MSSSAFAVWIDATSLWWIAFWLLLAMIVASQVGNVIRRRLRRKLAANAKNLDEAVDSVLSATLGLLALLMGFTFALAVDRFETRRARVLEEANAIGTTYLRAQLLEEPHRSRISGLLVEYTDNRIDLAGKSAKEARHLLGRNDRLVTELWVATVEAFPTIRRIDFSSAFLDSMNTVIDLAESRKAAREARVPNAVYVVLFIYIVAAAGLHGYTLDGPRERWAGRMLFLLLTLSLMLIIDVDRPVRGGISESQRPMEDLRASLRSWPPELFNPPERPAPGNTR
jgi:hypothetical protein